MMRLFVADRHWRRGVNEDARMERPPHLVRNCAILQFAAKVRAAHGFDVDDDFILGFPRFEPLTGAK
jgi:hypothetical protein